MLRRYIICGILLIHSFILVDAQVIADHTVIAEFDSIPEQYIDSVKSMLVSMAGESHSSAYRIGAELLEELDTVYQAETYSGDPIPAVTNQFLRIGRHRIIGEDYFFSEARIASMKLMIAAQYSDMNPFTVMGFAWCWDMTDDNPPGGLLDTLYDVRWAGRSEGGPDGNMRWGLDSADQALTGNTVCMDTYLEALESYILYCKENSIPTTWVFTTGPVDYNGGTENGFQREIKQAYIRDYVNEDQSRILFDYADILCWSDSGGQHFEDWDDNGNIRSHPQIHPDNMMDYDELWNLVPHSEDGDHIGEVGAIRLTKAMWWMLARIAGWEGLIIQVTGITVSSYEGIEQVSVGDTLRFSAVVSPETATFKEVSWSIINGTGTASIDTLGLLTAGNPGSVTVVATAKDSSGVNGSFQLNILTDHIPVTEIIVESANGDSALISGQSLQFTATVLPEDASNKELTWNVSNGTGTATISMEGLLTAGNPGTVTVLATASDGSAVSSNFGLTILRPDILVSSIDISSDGGISVLEEGETLQLYAAVLPSDADNQNVFWHVTSWQSGSDHGSITPDGLFLAISEGDVDVVATAQDGSGVYDLFTVSILGPSLVGVQNSESLVLYPNPGDGFFYLNAGSIEIVLVQVSDNQGSLIEEIKPEAGAQIIELDLRDQPPGHYIIRAFAAKRYMAGQTIIIR